MTQAKTMNLSQLFYCFEKVNFYSYYDEISIKT